MRYFLEQKIAPETSNFPWFGKNTSGLSIDDIFRDQVTVDINLFLCGSKIVIQHYLNIVSLLTEISKSLLRILFNTRFKKFIHVFFSKGLC